MKTRTCVIAALILLLMVAPKTYAQQSLVEAKELYASAAYEDALSTLNKLKGTSNGGESHDVERYRALCLLALGRPADAQLAIEAVVRAQPLYEPDEIEASPRVRTAFREVRRRILPSLVQQHYSAGKAAFDGKDYESAEAQFATVIELIDDPALKDSEAAKPFADMRMLASGFRDLARAAAVPAEPEPEAPVEPEPPVEKPSPNRLYTSADTDVTPPTTIRQQVPRWAPRLPVTPFQKPESGVLHIIIGTDGTVESAVLRKSVHPSYDPLLLEATQSWRYGPALRDGVPVRFSKAIQVSVDSR
jgi:tetratricopeptide (TPR) repeat protein